MSQETVDFETHETAVNETGRYGVSSFFSERDKTGKSQNRRQVLVKFCPYPGQNDLNMLHRGSSRIGFKKVVQVGAETASYDVFWTSPPRRSHRSTPSLRRREHIPIVL